MALSPESAGIRKGVLISASVALVYCASGARDVNWVISMNGAIAWFFVLCVNCYYAVMWYIYRNIVIPDPHSASVRFRHRGQITGKGGTNTTVDRYFFGRFDGNYARQTLARRFTDIAACVGVLVSLGGLCFAAYDHLADRPPAPAHKATYEHRY